MPDEPPGRDRRDRLLPWIAAERSLRALALLAIGIVLITHPHTNWAADVTRFVQKLGLNPQSNWVHSLTEKISRIGPGRTTLFGIVAIAYGVLEATEAYGLWRARRWGEWLTVLATSLLFIPELWELTKSASLLKVGALLANAAVVAYLIWRLRSPRRTAGAAPGPPSAGRE